MHLTLIGISCFIDRVFSVSPLRIKLRALNSKLSNYPTYLNFKNALVNIHFSIFMDPRPIKLTFKVLFFLYSFNVAINAGTLTVCFNVEHLVPCKLFCRLPFGKNTRSASSVWRLLVARFYCFLEVFFFPQCFVGVQTDRSRAEGRLSEPDVETSVCLSFLLLQHLPSIFYRTKKRSALFFPTVNNLPIGWRHCVHKFGVQINFPTSLSPKTT